MEQKGAIDIILKQIAEANKNFDLNIFWLIYEKCKENIHKIVNKGVLTYYMPEQIAISH